MSAFGSIGKSSSPVVVVDSRHVWARMQAWDRDSGRPLHNAIVWMDTRTAELCDDLAQELSGGQDHFRPITGLPISTYFSAMKWRWMIDNVPSVKDACESGRAMFGTIDSWLLYRLTGGEQGESICQGGVEKGSIGRLDCLSVLAPVDLCTYGKEIISKSSVFLLSL